MPTIPSDPDHFSIVIPQFQSSAGKYVTFTIPAGFWNSGVWHVVGTVDTTGLSLKTVDCVGGGTDFLPGAQGSYDYTGAVGILNLDAINAAAGGPPLSVEMIDGVAAGHSWVITDTVTLFTLTLNGGGSGSSSGSGGSGGSSGSGTSGGSGGSGSGGSGGSSGGSGSSGSSGRSSRSGSGSSRGGVGSGPGAPSCPGTGIYMPDTNPEANYSQCPSGAGFDPQTNGNANVGGECVDICIPLPAWNNNGNGALPFGSAAPGCACSIPPPPSCGCSQ